MSYARVINNVAFDVRSDSPAGCFTPNIVAEFQAVPNEVQNGWIFNAGVWAAPVPHVPTAEEIAAAAAEAAAALQSAKDAKWEQIKALRDYRLLNGGYPAGGHWFYSDLIARSQHLANARAADLVAQAGGDLNATMMLDGSVPRVVKSMDNGYMAITANLAHTIMSGAELHESRTYTAGIVHKVALDASSHPADYDFSGGWPLVFGEE